MSHETLDLCCNPVGMKDEDMALDRCPRHEYDDDDIDRSVDEHPNTAEGRRCRRGHTRLKVIQVPDDIGDFVDETEGDHENDHVVVDSDAKCSLHEQVIEHEGRA